MRRRLARSAGADAPALPERSGARGSGRPPLLGSRRPPAGWPVKGSGTVGQAGFGHRRDGLLLGGCLGVRLGAVGRRIRRGLIRGFRQDGLFRRERHSRSATSPSVVASAVDWTETMATGSTTSASAVSAVASVSAGASAVASCSGVSLRRRCPREKYGLFIGRAVLGACLVDRARQAAIGVLDPLGLAAQGALMGDDDARRAAGDRVGGLLALFRRAGALVDLEVPARCRGRWPSTGAGRCR